MLSIIKWSMDVRTKSTAQKYTVAGERQKGGKFFTTEEQKNRGYYRFSGLLWAFMVPKRPGHRQPFVDG
jgi:hypothetical protein